MTIVQKEGKNTHAMKEESNIKYKILYYTISSCHKSLLLSFKWTFTSNSNLITGEGIQLSKSSTVWRKKAPNIHLRAHNIWGNPFVSEDKNLIIITNLMEQKNKQTKHSIKHRPLQLFEDFWGAFKTSARNSLFVSFVCLSFQFWFSEKRKIHIYR